MGKKKKPEYQYRWTIPALAKVCDLSESYLYRLIREYRLFRDADGSIDGIGNIYNPGMLVQILPPKLNTEYIAFVREVYNLPPTGFGRSGKLAPDTPHE